MFVVYLYDIKAKNKKEFNRVKRRFYYNLARLIDSGGVSNIKWITKSSLLAFEKDEFKLDAFFREFEKYLIIYKLYASSVEVF